MILSNSHLGFAPPSHVEVIQGDCDPLPRLPPEHVLTVCDRGVHAGVIRGRETPHFLYRAVVQEMTEGATCEKLEYMRKKVCRSLRLNKLETLMDTKLKMICAKLS